ncbi:hypothetical protein DMN91_012951 [Ooceraea biroi]|uniref:Protein CREG1 n=1 Tax=Ooceraea biroi TaxID=2015173 RepID=A0A026VU35_OOCBI|nr:protein CREG1 [Ooceraea biroi]EZA47318.1 Protein CREG1 [Ooceraea biroi]RLU15064.1 hypothetical protein DMN91_012951 [Ooceraea biroi]
MLRIASVIVLCVLLCCDARKFDARLKHNEQWKEFEEFLKWKRTKQSREYNTNEFLTRAIGFDDDGDAQRSDDRVTQDPPPPHQAALMARYVVNQADWAAVATISTRKDVETFPVANLISIGDGPVGNGTGIPYMYLTPLDFTAKDLVKDHRATLLMSLAQGNYCKDKEWDPMDPRCARVMLSGKIKALKNTTEEHNIAKQLFFGRHPKLENMPTDHEFFLAKLKISAIALLDHFGGPKYINVKDYLHPPTEELQRHFLASYLLSKREFILP